MSWRNPYAQPEDHHVLRDTGDHLDVEGAANYYVVADLETTYVAFGTNVRRSMKAATEAGSTRGVRPPVPT